MVENTIWLNFYQVVEICKDLTKILLPPLFGHALLSHEQDQTYMWLDNIKKPIYQFHKLFVIPNIISWFLGNILSPHCQSLKSIGAQIVHFRPKVNIWKVHFLICTYCSWQLHIFGFSLLEELGFVEVSPLRQLVWFGQSRGLVGTHKCSWKGSTGPLCRVARDAPLGVCFSICFGKMIVSHIWHQNRYKSWFRLPTKYCIEK